MKLKLQRSFHINIRTNYSNNDLLCLICLTIRLLTINLHVRNPFIHFEFGKEQGVTQTPPHFVSKRFTPPILAVD